MGIYRRKKRLPDGSLVETGPHWIFYNQNGKQHHESSGSTKIIKARNLLKLREGDIAKGVPVSPHVNRLRFEQAVAHLLAHSENNLSTGHGALDKRRRKQHDKLKAKIANHLTPFFSEGRKMVSIRPADVTAYVAHRKTQGIIRKGKRVGDLTNAAINRELQILKRMFTLAVDAELLYHRPKIKLLDESPPRSGFFEDEQITAVLKHLPAPLNPVVRFGFLTGWRISSEVLPLEWRNLDFQANQVHLDAGTTKNHQGRTIDMWPELRALLETQRHEHERLKRAGHIFPYLFFREVAKGRRGKKSPKRITTFGKAWRRACRLAGCPGRIPHDLRRTAIRNFVRAGIPERVAMQMTGHKTRSVFERYNIVSDGDLQDAAQRMSGRHIINE